MVPAGVAWSAVSGYGSDMAVARAETALRWADLDAASTALATGLAAAPNDARLYDAIGTVSAIRYRWHATPNAAEQSIAAHEVAIALNPIDASLIASLARSLAILERFEEAEHAFRRALEIEPYNVAYLVELGSLLERVGRQNSALVAYMEAASIRPTDPIRARVEALVQR